MSARDEALAFSALGALLEGGASTEAAFKEVARRLPAGPTRVGLEEAQARVSGGVGALEALEAGFPQRADLFGEDEARLSARLKRLGQHHLRVYGLTRQMYAVALYPLMITLSAFALSVLLIFGALERLDLFDFGHHSPSALVLPNIIWFTLLITCGSLVLFIHTLKRVKVGRAPGWMKALPGAEVWDRRAAAEQLSLHALTLEAGGASKPLQAARFVDRVAYDLALKSPTPAEALEGLAARMTAEAEVAGERLVAACAYLFLILAALTVLAAFPVLYIDLFRMSAWIQ